MYLVTLTNIWDLIFQYDRDIESFTLNVTVFIYYIVSSNALLFLFVPKCLFSVQLNVVLH